MATIAEPDRAYVERLLALSPALATVRDLAQRFAALVRAHTADALTPWLADAEHCEGSVKNLGQRACLSWADQPG